MEPNLSTMSVTELKALAYDQLAQSEAIQRNLQVINQEIVKKSQKESAPVVEAIPVEEPNA